MRSTEKEMFNPKGFGFIERNDKEKDVFVHISAKKCWYGWFEWGQDLTFDVEDGPKGPSAVNLKTVKSVILFIGYKYFK